MLKFAQKLEKLSFALVYLCYGGLVLPEEVTHLRRAIMLEEDEFHVALGFTTECDDITLSAPDKTGETITVNGDHYPKTDFLVWVRRWTGEFGDFVPQVWRNQVYKILDELQEEEFEELKFDQIA